MVAGILLLAGCTSTQADNNQQAVQQQSAVQPQAPNSNNMQQPPAQMQTSPPLPEEPTAPEITVGAPDTVSKFTSASEGEVTRFYFMLQDSDGRNTVSDGRAALRIYDDTNETLYYKEVEVKSSDFVPYKFPLTGQKMGDAYEWRIKDSDIKKGIATYWGSAELTFTTPSGNRMIAESTTVSIPTYTDEELEQKSEQDYQVRAFQLNQKMQKGSFEVTVIKYGFFNATSFGKIAQYLRVDISTVNTGSETEYFSPNSMSLLGPNGQQYDTAYIGTLDTYKSLYPGSYAQGYVLFEEVPTDAIGLKLVFELGYDADYDKYVFEYPLGG